MALKPTKPIPKSQIPYVRHPPFKFPTPMKVAGVFLITMLVIFSTFIAKYCKINLISCMYIYIILAICAKLFMISNNDLFT